MICTATDCVDCVQGRNVQGGAYMPSGNGREMMLRQVQQTGFALDEARLYLDTHPCDAGAISYSRQISGMYQQAVDAYTASWGPLNSKDSTDAEYWTWINDPWPWEGGIC